MLRNSLFWKSRSILKVEKLKILPSHLTVHCDALKMKVVTSIRKAETLQIYKQQNTWEELWKISLGTLARRGTMMNQVAIFHFGITLNSKVNDLLRHSFHWSNQTQHPIWRERKYADRFLSEYFAKGPVCRAVLKLYKLAAALCRDTPNHFPKCSQSKRVQTTAERSFSAILVRSLQSP